MRLTNKQLEIVVNEIYKQVSKPIIEANNKALEEVTLPENDPYLKDVATYNSVQESIDKLKKIQENINDKWESTELNGFNFNNCWPCPIRYVNDYIKHIKQNSVVLADFPSRYEIEKQIILAGNKDIPELIKTVVNMFKK